MLAAHALHASIGVLLDTGMTQVEQQVLDNTCFLIEACSPLPDVDILSARSDNRLSGIFTFRKRNRNMDAMYNWLVERGVVCALRGGGIRLSPHFHTPREQLELLIAWIGDY